MLWLIILKVFILLVIILERINGKKKRYNVLLMVYWLLSILCWVPILRSKIINFDDVIQIFIIAFLNIGLIR